MRIISGSLKGRQIVGYDILGTRPTMDRVKESIFAIIQNNLHDSVVLDLFSGSGNYGIEAISNGARKCYFNDNNKQCVEVINNNLNKLNIASKCIVANNDFKKALRDYREKKIRFDLVFLDPPYEMKVVSEILDYMSENNLLNSKALVICELIDNDLKEEYRQLKCIRQKKYGEKTVLIYQNIL